MRTIEDIYAEFSEFVRSGGKEAEGMDYEAITRKFGVSPESMDEILTKELGLDGEEFIQAVRSASM